MAYSIKRILVNAVMSAVILLPGIATAEYIFTAPPRETPEAGQKVYGPLADHLSSILNEKVSYQHPGNWVKYKKSMQKGAYDIVFDGPHFAAWRLDKKQAQPVVKLPGSLSFVLVTRKELEFTSKEQLVGKKVCTLPSPNLGAMTVYSMYPNQMSQPRFIFVKGGMKKVAQSLLSGKCDAAILRKGFFANKMKQDQREGLIVLETSQSYVNQGVTLSAQIPEAKRKMIIEALTNKEGKKAAAPLLSRFSTKKKSFIAANEKEYSELNLLKKNDMFGW